MKCPKCGDECDQNSVDVGVGVIHGPWGCMGCGWSEDSEYDLSGGKSGVRGDFVVDPLGGMTRFKNFLLPGELPGEQCARCQRTQAQHEEKEAASTLCVGDPSPSDCDEFMTRCARCLFEAPLSVVKASGTEYCAGCHKEMDAILGTSS